VNKGLINKEIRTIKPTNAPRHGRNITIVSAQQAKDIGHYKIIKEKLYKTKSILKISAFVGFVVLIVY
jgi:hypothetical protein